MGFFDWLPFARRTDALPALPGPFTHPDAIWPHEVPARLDQRYDGGSSVMNLFTGAGGSRDKGAAARPNPYVLPLSLHELLALYGFNGIAARIVDLPVDRATRRGWTVPEMAKEDTRLRVPERFNEGAKWARLMGAGLLVPITADDVPPGYRGNPSAWLQQPLDLTRIGAVDALQSFDAVEATPVSWDRDPASPTFRLPLFWRISADGFQVVLHASRVIHLRGRKRPTSQIHGGWTAQNGLPDDSTLQSVWDQVSALSQVGAGGATLALEIKDKVLKLSGLSARMTGDEGADILTQLQLIAQADSQLGVKLIGEGDEWSSTSTPPTGFSDLSDSAWEMLAGALGWPAIILRGDAPSGLSTDGSSGHESFRQYVSTYQESQRHDLERLYEILFAAQDGPTSGEVPDPSERALVFAALDEPNQASVAATRLVVAQTDEINVRIGAYSAAVVAARYQDGTFAFDLADVPIPNEVEEGLAAELRGPGGLTALPGLIAAGVLSLETAAKLLGLPAPPEPDPAEEAAMEAMRLQLAGAPPAPEPVPEDVPHADAIAPDSVCILIPAADPGLRDAVETAIGQRLRVENDPHLTLLYLGSIDPAALPEVDAVAADEASRTLPGTVERGTVNAFAPGKDGVPIVVEFSDLWAVQGLRDALLARLAHVLVAPQHRRFRGHLTLGYAPEPLTAEALGALSGIDASRVRVAVNSVVVNVGGVPRLVVPTGDRA